MKKLIAFLLAVLMLLALVGCAGEGGKPSDTTTASPDESTSPDETTDPAETEDTYYKERNEAKDDLPEKLDFNEADVNVLYQYDERRYIDATMEWFAEDDATDVVEEAVLKRNSYLEDRLNINLVLHDFGDRQEIADAIRTAVMSFTGDFDVYSATNFGSAMQNGYFYNLRDLDYIDLSKPWWCDYYNDTITIEGRTFLATGDLAITLTSHNLITYYNKQLWSDFYGDEDIYQIARDGNWTLDRYTQYCNGVYQDLNQNGLADYDDLYGNIHPFETPNTDAWGAAAGLVYTTYDEDTGYFTYTLTKDDRAIQFVEKMMTLMWRNNATYVSENAEMDTDEDLMKKFRNSTALFTVAKVFCAQLLRDMPDPGFGIMPLPKFNEEQETYNTTPEGGVTLFGVINGCSDPDMSACFLEAAAAESYRYVTPAYYDTAVKIKYARDIESAEMLELSMEGIRYDFAQLVGTPGGGTILSNTFLSETLMGRFSSYVDKNLKGFNSGLSQFIDDIRAVE